MTGMNSEQALAVFENYKIRRVYDKASETWYFSVVDVVAALIQQPDYQTARKYWNKLKGRLKNEGSQSVTDCHQLREDRFHCRQCGHCLVPPKCQRRRALGRRRMHQLDRGVFGLRDRG